MDDDKWMSFNDSSVSLLESSSISTTFGGIQKSSMGGMSRMFSHGTNAYMLMYRQFDPERNLKQPTAESISEELKMAVEEAKTEEKKTTSSYGYNYNLRRCMTTYQGENKTIPIEKDKTVGDLKEKFLESFSITADPKDVRIRRASIYNVLKDPFTDDTIIGDIKGQNKFTVEIKGSDDEFEEVLISLIFLILV